MASERASENRAFRRANPATQPSLYFSFGDYNPYVTKAPTWDVNKYTSKYNRKYRDQFADSIMKTGQMLYDKGYDVYQSGRPVTPTHGNPYFQQSYSYKKPNGKTQTFGGFGTANAAMDYAKYLKQMDSWNAYNSQQQQLDAWKKAQEEAAKAPAEQPLADVVAPEPAPPPPTLAEQAQNNNAFVQKDNSLAGVFTQPKNPAASTNPSNSLNKGSGKLIG